jgi:hypothetical protein
MDETAGGEHMDVNTEHLRYLDASRVMGPAGIMSLIDVRTRQDETVGCVHGVLIDPEQRKLRYLIVEASEWLNHRRYLLPLDATATINPKGHSLCVELESNDFSALDEFDIGDFRQFTEEDAIAPTLTRYLS